MLSSTINASQIHYVGLRDIDKMEQIKIDEEDIYAPRSLNVEQLIKVLKDKKITHLYLHFDVDCLEPKDYDKTYYKVPDGLKIKEAEECIIGLQKHFNLVGSSVLESITTKAEELEPIDRIIKLLLK